MVTLCFHYFCLLSFDSLEGGQGTVPLGTEGLGNPVDQGLGTPLRCLEIAG